MKNISKNKFNIKWAFEMRKGVIVFLIFLYIYFNSFSNISIYLF